MRKIQAFYRPMRVQRGRRATLLTLGLWLSTGTLAQTNCALPGGPLPSESRTVFMLDTSASMEGEGGTPKIFGAVKTAVARALAGQQLPGRVEVVGFDQGVRVVEDFRWPGDRAKLEAQLSTLKAEGRNTWLYRSLEQVLTGLRRRPESATTVYVVTDGRNNDAKATYTMRRALAAFEKKRGAYDRLYYVALGTTIPPETRAALERSGYASGVELPAGQAPDLSPGGALLPALVEVGPGRTPLAPGGYSVDARAAEAAGAQLNVQQGGNAASLTLSGADRLPTNTNALLCKTAAGGPQRTLLRLRGGTVAIIPPTQGASTQGTSTAVPGLALLTNAGGELRLSPGGSLDLAYQLGGPASQSATLSFPDLPNGVEARLNDRDAREGLSLHGGERATLHLREQGLSGSSLSVVPRVNGVSADSASVLVMTGQAVTGAASTAPSSSLVLLNPGASGTLRPGQSVTWRYRVEGGPATIQALRSPAGTHASLDGARIGKPIGAGGNFAVSIVNDNLQGAASPQVQLTSGKTVDLPAVRPASSSGGAWWLWPLLILLALLGGLAWWLGRRRAAPTAPATAFERPRGLTVEGDQVIVHGEGYARRSAALGAEALDVGAATSLPVLDGLKLESSGEGPRLVGLPPGLRLTERGRTLAVGDTLSRDLMYAFASGVSAAAYAPSVPPSVVVTPPLPAPIIEERFEPSGEAAVVTPEPPVGEPPNSLSPVVQAPPAETPVAELPAAETTQHLEAAAPTTEPPSREVVPPPPPPVVVPTPEATEPDVAPAARAGTDFAQLSQDIASLGFLGGVGGLGVPRGLELAEGTLILRGDEDEEPQELPEGVTDLGEAFGVPAMQGFAVEREAGEGGAVRLAGLPFGFRVLSGSTALAVGNALPHGQLGLEVPESLRATVRRVREALGEEVDTRDAGIDLSDIERAINLDDVFGGLDGGHKN